MTDRSPNPAEAVEHLATTAQELSAQVTGQPEFVLHHKADPTTWSITEILGHLVDHEQRYIGPVFMAILTRSNPAFTGYDQDAAVIAAQYAHADAGDLIIRFDALRTETVAMLRGLTPAQWERIGNDDEGHTQTLASLVGALAAHDRDHLEQIAVTLRHTPGANR